MPKRVTKREDKESKKESFKGQKEDDVLFAFIATFLSIVGFVIAIVARRNDKYVMFYAKQSLIVFIVGAVLGVAASLLRVFPVIGDLIYFAISLLVVLVWIISWVYSLSGEMKDVPIIGKWAENINL